MRSIITGLLLAAVVAFGAAPAEAKTLRGTYGSLYRSVAKHHGKRAPGRNIVKYGVQTKHGTRRATSREVARSVRTFRRWLAPPPAPAAIYVAPRDVAVAPRSAPAAAAPAYSGGRYAIPASIVQCESRGNYHAYNPSSGAGGAYQIIPSTWRAYGGSGSPHTAPPAEQDRIARKVWAEQGRSAWSC
jgi:hypothetical protein